MIRTIGLSLLAFLAIQMPCFARLGETFEQCQARYGLLVRVDPSVRSDYPQYLFRKGDVEVRVRFINSHSAQEMFAGIGRNLSDVEAADILNANAQGSSWSALEVGHAKSYTRQDGKAVARYVRSKKDPKSDALTVESTEFSQIFKGQETGF